ncbi:hypothetical protein Tco_0912940 [Tanacetum coccineum]
MTLTATNWNSPIQLQVKDALENDVVSIVNSIDTRIVHFEKEFVKKAVELLRDYKSLEKEADESFEKEIF